MTCGCCQAASEAPAYRMHCPTCIYCGARLIQGIQKLPITRSEVQERCRAVLADWLAYGHDEQALRALAKGPRAIAPQEVSPRSKQTRALQP